jgi:large repetitive protein
MKKILFLFVCYFIAQSVFGQSRVDIGTGSSISIGNGSDVSMSYRDGTMMSAGTFNSRSITFDPVASAATSVAQTSFNANWNASAGASGYKLDVSTSANFATFVTGYQNLDVGSATTFNVNSGLSSGTSYYYRVRAYDIDGITGYSNIIIVITAPLAPTANAATNVNESSFTANWGVSAGATKYYLDVASDADFNNILANWNNKNIGNVVSYSVTTDLSANNTYYYRVRAANDYGSSVNSNVITVLTAPTPPNALVATPITQTSFTAKWNASNGATKYYLDVSTINTFASFVTGFQNLDVGNVTSYPVAGLTEGTTYYYRIRSSNGNGISTSSGTITVLTVPPNPIAAISTNIGQLTFDGNWATSTSASKYYVDVATDNLFNSPVPNWTNVDVGNVLTYSVNTDLVAGTTYYFRVRAFNASGTSGNSNVISLVTIPSVPVSIAATNPAQTSFSANWNAVSGVTGYRLDVSTSNTFTSFVTGYNNLDVSNVTTYSVNTNLTAGTTYYYRVRGYNANGSSGSSNITSLTIVPPDPTATAATGVSTTSFVANWNAVLGATNYFIDVATDNSFSTMVTGWTDINAGAGTSFTVNTNLTAGTNYYYRIRANNVSGTSGNSGTITVLTSPITPVATAATNPASTSFSANWGAVAGADGYYLDVSTSTNFDPGNFVTGYENLDVTNVLTYSVNSNLNAGTTYYYRIRSYNSGGISGNSNKITFISLPSGPITAAATSISGTGFTANWNPSLSATGYKLDVSTSTTFASFVAGYNNLDVLDVTSYAVSGLTPNTTYYYRVRGYNDYGTDGDSPKITVLTSPDKPAVVAATTITSTGFTSNWGATAGATGYYLDVSTSNTFASFLTGFNSLDVGNVTSFLVSGLSGGSTYYYRVRAYNSVNSSIDSDVQTVLTLSLGPAASAASTITATSFDANWSASAGATGYRLDVSTDPAFGANLGSYDDLDVGNVLIKAVSGLTPGNTYYYRIRAYNASGANGNSNIITLSTIPPTPIEQVASSITSNGFAANWNAANGATGYKLDVSTTSDFSSFVPGYNDLNVGNVTTYSVTGLASGTSYYYRIRAYNTGGTSSSSNSINPTTASPIPAAPSPSPASNFLADGTGFNANWTASTGATTYYLDVSTNSGFGGGNFVTGYQDLNVGDVRTYSITGLTAGITYYYRLRANNVSGTSSNSLTTTLTTIPAAPGGLTAPAPNINNSDFTAMWNSTTGATGYKLDVSTVSNFASFVSGYSDLELGNVTSYSVIGLTGSTDYYFRVRAYNTGGTSPSSAASAKITTSADAAGALTATAASTFGETSFRANWNAYTGAGGPVTSYKIDVSGTSDFTSLVAGWNNTDVGNVLNYNINTGLTAGTVYYYRVKAYNGGAQAGNTSNTISTLTLPPSFTPGVPTNVTQNSFTANWVAQTSATGYYIDVSTDAGFGSFVSGYNNKYVNSALQCDVTGLTAGTLYYYRIRAKNSSGINNTAASAQITIVPANPVSTPASAIQSTSFTANWNASTGASKYYLDVSSDPNFGSFVTNWNNADVGAVTTYSVNTNLSSGTTYYYRVRAYNNSGSSGNSAVITLTTAPAAPTADNPSLVNKTSFRANWTGSTGATKYFIDVATANTFAGSYVAGYQNLDVGNSASLLVTGLSQGTTYYYRIRAFNSNGTSTDSGIKSALTIPAEPVLNPVSTFSSSAFTATWGLVTGASGYKIDVSTVSNFASYVPNWHDVDLGNVTSKSVNTDLLAGTNYYFRIRAYNTTGASDNSGVISITTAPAALNATAATSPHINDLTANWDAGTGVDGYLLDVSTVSNFLSFVSGFNNKDVGNTTNYIVTGLSGGTTYYYRVRSYTGGRTSDNSNVITALTIPSAATATTASSIVEGSFSANWNSVTGASGYYLDVSTNSGFSTFVGTFNNKNVLNVSTFLINGLSANSTYYFRIRAYNTSGTTSNSNTISVLTVPAAPVVIAASSITNTTLKANWNVTTGATKYYLDVSTTNTFNAGTFIAGYENQDVGNVTTYDVTNLNGNINYYYRVRAYNASGQGISSNTITATTNPDPSPAPTATAGTSLTKTSFNVNWAAVPGASGYKIDVSTNIGFAHYLSGFQDLDIGNVITYTVPGLTPGTTYYYRARSYNVMGTSSNSNVVTILTVPNAPVSAAATSLAENSFNANWAASAGATNYYLDVSTDPAFGSFVGTYNNKDVGNVVTFSVSGLLGGTTYYYRVRASNASGTNGISGSQTVLTVPTPPVSTAASTITQTSFTANWNSALSATKYFLDVSSDAGFASFVSGYENKDVGNVLTFSVSGLNANTSYFYRVRALNASGTSTNSNVITIIGIPTAVAAGSITMNSFAANWNAVAGATAYRLDVSDDTNFSTFVAGWQDVNIAGGAVITKLVNSGLTANKEYYYRIRSTDGSVTSASSNSISFFTAPVAPVAIAATAVVQTNFLAHWNASVGGATGYKLDVSTDVNFGPGTFVADYEDRDILALTSDSIKTDLNPGTNYYYRVRGYNSSAQSVSSNTITLLTKMQAPATQSPTNVMQTSFDANWSFSTGATKYYLDVATDFGFTSILPAYSNRDVGNVNTFSISGLTLNTSYFYRVRAFNPSETTSNSTVVQLKTQPLPPVANSASSVTNTGFTANWTPQGGASPGYLIDVATDASFTNILPAYQAFGISGSTNTTVSLSMTVSNPYFYRVRAYTTFSESVNSNIICVAKQPTNLQFETIDTTSYKVSFKVSVSGGRYIVVRGTGNQPAFVPVDGNNYSVSLQGADKIVYVGTDTLFTENNIVTKTSYYYKVYNYHQSGGASYYVADSPLSGSNKILSGTNPTGSIPATAAITTLLFPQVGMEITFPDGSVGTTLTASKENNAPASGIGISSTAGVNYLEPLYFAVHSTNPTPGNYEIILDFSSLGYTDWSSYKVLKRTDENSEWQDITLAPINAVITNRSTDGIPGRFTIAGLSSFSQFVLGKTVSTNVPQSITILNPIGGERWQAGTTHSITWKKGGYFAGVKLEYSTDSGISWKTILNEILVSLEYYEWKVPSGFNSDKCLVRVSNWYNPDVYDVTPGTFSIYDPDVPLQKLGDVNNDGFITSYDASLVLLYVVGNTSFNDAQKVAADVNKDGSIGANDASRILMYCVNGSWPLSKRAAVTGTVTTGTAICKENKEFIFPVKVLNLSGASSIEITLDFANNPVSSISYESLLKNDWMIASNLADSRFKIAMAGQAELESGLLGNLKIKFKDPASKIPIPMMVQLNDEAVVNSEINIAREIPTQFSLGQNYPNPFNPETVIRYELPVDGKVELTVFDLLGREIIKLVNEEKSAGRYEVKFNGSNLSSGVYFYRMHANKFTQTKKLLLMK